MLISFVITGTLEIDKDWGSPAQISKDMVHDIPYVLTDRLAGQWPGSKVSCATTTKVVTVD